MFLCAHALNVSSIYLWRTLEFNGTTVSSHLMKFSIFESVSNGTHYGMWDSCMLAIYWNAYFSGQLPLSLYQLRKLIAPLKCKKWNHLSKLVADPVVLQMMQWVQLDWCNSSRQLSVKILALLTTFPLAISGKILALLTTFPLALSGKILALLTTFPLAILGEILALLTTFPLALSGKILALLTTFPLALSGKYWLCWHLSHWPFQGKYWLCWHLSHWPFQGKYWLC